MIPVQAYLVFASALAALLVTSSLSRHPPDGLRVRNFRGVETPVTGGVVLLTGLIVAEAMAGLISQLFPAAFGSEFRLLEIPPGSNLPVLALALGFFALGAVDDLAGSGAAKGLLGHLRALLRGKVTGGIVKAGGGLALSFVISLSEVPSLGRAILNAILISLSANLFNLLDLRPGRSTKLFIVGAIPLLLLASFRGIYLLVLATLVGAALGWLPADLKERGMLGDSGANMLGAVVGAGAVLRLGTQGKLLMLGTLVVLTLVSEKWSFSAIIERFPPLRWFDRLGRMP